ncbi:hypothetical protein LR48_Vigan272s003700 [Vigna angularis]|uniref:Uncharacterized protein n=1 Tax=Phaseolus angularis TaxID=3914 RepID=A0A0L9T8N8_PHAAN|nr:hypothetical protein LR48_Vigan272s003700 [Vigna angularis]
MQLYENLLRRVSYTAKLIINVDEPQPPCLAYTTHKCSTCLPNLHHLHARSSTTLTIPPTIEHLYHKQKPKHHGPIVTWLT